MFSSYTNSYKIVLKEKNVTSIVIVIYYIYYIYFIVIDIYCEFLIITTGLYLEPF